MFSRKYTYICSSNECPAKSGNCDNFSDMTLHPTNVIKNINQRVVTSIGEWESGSSKAALISCKERFSGTPNHSEFITE